MSRNHLGRIQVYSGDGKGKTTAALGLALRAVGRGYKTVVIQFMKKQETGEYLVQERLKPELEIYQFGQKSFIDKNNIQAEDKELAQRGLDFAKEIVKKKIDILILDEINLALDFKLLDLKEVLNFLDNIPPGIEVILTGRGVDPEILKRADLVTEMKKIKHYFDRGLETREGIEF